MLSNHNKKSLCCLSKRVTVCNVTCLKMAIINLKKMSNCGFFQVSVVIKLKRQLRYLFLTIFFFCSNHFERKNLQFLRCSVVLKVSPEKKNSSVTEFKRFKRVLKANIENAENVRVKQHVR